MNAPAPLAPRPIAHHIPTALGTLHVSTCGTAGETIVLWPSIFTDHHIYDGIAQRLGASFRFLLIDGPAHGQSEGRRAEFTMEACAAAMARVMAHFGVERAIAGGTSWGGITAAHLALQQPHRVKALILMNTPMQIDSRQPGMKGRLIAAGARWLLKTSAYRNGVADSFFSPEVLAANPVYAAAFHAMLKAADPPALAAAVRSVILRGRPLQPHMAGLQMPVLVIGGRADTMYPIAAQEAAARLAPQGHFIAVEGGHISAIEAPDAVAAGVKAFIAREITAKAPG